MIPKNRMPVHPGKILLEEFLKPMEVTQVDFAKQLNIPIQRINNLINGKRGISPETAWLLAKAFKMSPEFWMNLQSTYDLAAAREKMKLAA